MLVPLYGFLEGDSMGLLILADDAQPLRTVIQKLCDMAAVRVDAAGQLELHHDGERLDPALTVAEAGLRALDKVDVRRRRSPS